MTIKMKAAIFVGPRQVEIQKVPLPQPGAGQVRIQMEGSGICGSNVCPWQGMPWSRYPTEAGAWGHEGWGIIDEVGAGVHRDRIGDRVAVLSGHAFAEFDLALADHTVVLPEEWKTMAFPGEALGCAMNIFRRSQIEAGQNVAVIGVGFLGALLIRLAKNQGARVVAASRRLYAGEIARQMGADDFCVLTDLTQSKSEMLEKNYGRPYDRVIEATGHSMPLDLAAEILRDGGRLMIAGYHQDGPRQINLQLWNWKGLDVINAHERDPQVCLQGIRDGISAQANGKVDVQPLITHRFPIEDIGRGLDLTANRPDGFLKAVVDLRTP
jgi:NADPH2:quinone reductase